MVLWEEPIFREEARLKLWKAFTDLQILFLRKQKFIPDTIFQPLSVMKRGTIHLYKISILFDNREFEHDIYELIRAFYPEAEIAVSYEEEDGANTADLLFRVEKQEQSFLIRYQNESNTGVTSAEIIKGHSSDDAPLSCTEEKDAARQQRKEQKDVLKYSLYKLLTKLTGKTLPWGESYRDPAGKACHAMIEAGMKNSRDCRRNAETLSGKS